jgi:teichuronic acid biosynthesis glycosyltransferase TuaG
MERRVAKMTCDQKHGREPLISIIMPAYNCESYIEIAVRSVMQQSYPNWELLVLDDGSSDRTPAIVQTLCLEDERIRLIKNPANMGVAKTRNYGLDLSQGDYVAFLDSDDRWHPDKLAIQMQRMEQERAHLSYTSYAIINNEGKSCKNDYIVPPCIMFDDLLKQNVLGCSTVMLSGEVARRYRFATDFYHEDYCLWLNILRGGYRAVGCPEVLTDWRLIVNSRSFDKRKSALNRWRIYRNYLHLSLPRSIKAFMVYAWGGMKKYYGS